VFVFEAVLSLVILVVSMGMTLLFVLVSLAVPGVFLYGMFKNRQMTQELLRTGAPGSAQVLAVQQTGVYVNHNPQCRMTLEVQPADAGPSFVSSVTAVVPMVALSRVQPGAVLDVRYDPKDTSRLAIAGM
jgi:hypothetical protein